MTDLLKDTFKDFPDQSRVWLYQSDKALTSSEMEKIETDLNSFVAEWAAHGNKLWANAKVLNKYIVLITVNDELVPPSGCSIDASVHRMKSLGNEMGIDFFNRMQVTILDEEEVKQVPFTALTNYPNSLIFDTLVNTLGELRSAWPSKIEKSNFAAVLS